jgi:hypothetical protein
LAVRHADFPKFRNLELTGEALPGTKKAKKERYGTEIEEQTHALSSQNKFIISYSDHQLENEQNRPLCSAAISSSYVIASFFPAWTLVSSK